MTEVAARPARTERNILPKKNEKTWGGAHRAAGAFRGAAGSSSAATIMTERRTGARPQAGNPDF